MKNTKYLGFFFILISAIIYGSNGFIVRHLEGVFGSFSQQYVQCIISSIITLILILILKTKVKTINKKDIIPFIFLLLSSASIMVLLYTPYQKLQLGTVLFLFYSVMLLTGIVGGMIFFKEKLTLVKLLAIILSIVGIVLIFYSNIHLATSSPKYIILALLGGLAIGIYSLSSKKLSTNYPPMFMYLLASIAGIIVAAMGAFVFKEHAPIMVVSPAWGWIIIYSVGAVISNIAMFEGFKRLEAQTATIVSISEILVAVLAGLIIYSEIPTIMTLIGGVLIVLANVLVIVVKERNPPP